MLKLEQLLLRVKLAGKVKVSILLENTFIINFKQLLGLSQK
jgi:hypothetical protein